mgnify:CR=1 FL=1
MVYTSTTPTTPTSTTAAPQSTYETTLSAALEHARRLTQMNDGVGTDVAIAWETVEELRIAKARKASQPAETTSAFEHYCEANPEAPECRIYDC